MSKIEVGFKYKWQLERDGEIIDQSPGWTENKTTTEGLTECLETYFRDGTVHDWYVALMGTAKSPAEGDTYAAIMSTANYETVSYSEPTRPSYVAGAASGKQASNSDSVAAFTMTATDDVNGAMIVSNNTKDNASAGNYLFSLSQFDSAVTDISIGDRLFVTATCTISSQTGE